MLVDELHLRKLGPNDFSDRTRFAGEAAQAFVEARLALPRLEQRVDHGLLVFSQHAVRALTQDKLTALHQSGRRALIDLQNAAARQIKDCPQQLRSTDAETPSRNRSCESRPQIVRWTCNGCARQGPL